MALKVGELFASFNIDSSGMSGTISSIESSMEKLGSSMTKTGAAMSLAVTAPLTKIGKDMLDAGMSFTAQMSTVEAISGATAAEMEQLNAKALEMGSTTQFTATEAGEALEYMAMAGWKTEDMLDGLAPIMNLAAASGEDLGTTSDIVTDALTAFGLKAEDAGHFSDILAVASSNANTNVSMMGETFKYVAPVAGAMGYKAEDVAVAIGLMANSGIKAGQAGTALRSALSRLSAPTDEAQKYMTALGLSTTDSSGAVKPFNVLLKDMRQSFSKLTKAQQIQYASEIFGQEAMSGMLAIINASDEDIQKLTASIEDCDGATQRMADTVLDNAQGDLTLFKSAVEGAQVALFKLNEDAIRGVIQGATSLVEKFNQSSDTTKQAALKMGIFAAAIGPAMVAMGNLVSILGGAVPMLAALVSPLGLVAAGLALFSLAALDADNAIGMAFSPMAQKAAAMLPGIAAQATTAVAEISTRIPALSESIVSGVSSLIPAVVEAASSIITSLLDAFTANADSIAAVGLSIVTSITDSIASAAPTLLPAAFSAIVAALTALIDNAPELLQSGINLAGKIVEGIKGTDWAKLGTDLLTSITGALEAAVATATAAIKKAVGGIMDAIKEALGITGEEGPQELGQKVISGIKSGLEAAAKMALSVVTGIGSSIWNGIKTGLGVGESTEEDQTGQKMIDKVVTGLESAAKKAVETVKGIASGIWNAIKSGLGLGSEGEEGQAGKVGLDLLGKIVQGMSSAVTTAISVVKGIFGGIWDAITSAISGGGGGESESGEDVAKAAASGVVDGLIAGFRSAVKGVIDTVKEIFGGIWDAIKAVFGFGKGKNDTGGEDAKAAEDAGKSIMQGMKEGVTGSQEEVTTAAKDAGTAVIAQIEASFGIAGGTSSVMQTEGQAMMNGLGAGITAGQSVVMTALTTFTQSFVATAKMTLNSVTGMGLGMDVMNGLGNGIASNAPGTVSRMNMVAYSIVQTARSILNHSAGYSLGNDIMQGMVDGINSMSGSLSSVAGRVVRGAVSAMRRAANAHSPSRETIALGQDMDEGGAIGLSGGLMAAAAAKATRAAVEAIAGEARIHDPSRGTVMTARQSARQTASETARGLFGGGDRAETAREIGTAMADRLIESGVMNRKIYIGKREAGEELAEPVSKEINRKSQKTVSGHRAQGVIA